MVSIVKVELLFLFLSIDLNVCRLTTMYSMIRRLISLTSVIPLIMQKNVNYITTLPKEQPQLMNKHIMKCLAFVALMAQMDIVNQ